MMKWMIDYAHDKNGTLVRLFMFKGNDKARQYYQELGFKCLCDLMYKEL